MLASDVVCVYLANLMFNEPKDDGVQGQTACGLVVRNRVLAGWEGGDWVSLIKNHDKYASQPRKEPMVLGNPIQDDKFRRCLGIATNIYSGLEKDITYGALRYGRLNECTEEFKIRVVQAKNPMGLPLFNRVAQIGKQSFFL